MKKYYLRISSFLIAVLLLCAVFCGCDFGGGSVQPSKLPALPAPEVTIGADGVAEWDKVNSAMYYGYIIDGNAEKITTKCQVQLAENQTVRVRAFSGSENFSDSDYSAPKTYHKNEIAQLSFYAVNDLHGKFMDTDSQPGVDEFTAYLKAQYQDATREEILLSSGDMWQGTVESSSNKGQLMTEWMNEVGFVSMTLGNHEFDWGADVILPNSRTANFPFLAINVTENGSTVDYCQASTTVERGGVKIGIIGAIGNCLSSISGEHQGGLYFATGGVLTSLVQSEATRLREEDGCDFIVYSIHDGGSGFSSSGVNSVTDADMEYYDSELSDGYVDLVFEGHTHQGYILQDEYGVYHLQGGGENRYVSCAEVTFNTVTKEYTVTPKLLGHNVYANSSIEGDPVVYEIFEKYFPENNPYTNVLGTTAYDRRSDEILNLVAKLYYDTGVETWGNQYNIVLGGGYLNVRSPYSVSRGDVTYADLFSILPFDNEIVLGKIRGSDLKSRFFSTNDYSKKDYSRYTTITDSEIKNSQYYYIIVDTYTSTYGRNNITEVARLGSGIYARDLLSDYVASGGWS